MFHRRLVVGLVAMLGASTVAAASQESVLTWEKFRIESSGPVIVSGSQNAAGLRELHVEAFGKSFAIPESTLTKLRGVMINGLQISYEEGYPEVGGRTVYLLFSKGFVSGMQEGKLLVVKERGDLDVREAR